MKKPCLPSHPDFVDGCQTCQMWRDDPRLSKAVDLLEKSGAQPVPVGRVALPVLAPCAHEGRVIEHCQTCSGSKGEGRHVRFCLHPSPSDEDRDTCTRAYVSDKVQACVNCPDYTPGVEDAYERRVAEARVPLQWVSTARMTQDAIRLASILPASVKAIVGIPRSGMIPASIIAVHLHLPLYELRQDGTLHRLSQGMRGHGMPEPVGTYAVIDDTVYTGHAIRAARTHMKGQRAVFCAVYCRQRMAPMVDLYAAPLASPHLLEWNVANSRTITGDAINPIYGKGVAFDIDGIIVHDAESGGKLGAPYLVPRLCDAPLLATGRHERDRAQTVALLRSVGARWKKLEMFPDNLAPTPALIAEHKTAAFLRSGCGFFLESDPTQARIIAERSKKPVICPRANTVFGSDPT